MARGTGAYSSGLINGGTQNRYDFFQAIITVMKAYQSNGENAWEELDVLVDAVPLYDVVLHSVGDRSLGSGVNKGDTDIFVRLHVASNQIYARAYQDWSATSSTGNRATTDRSVATTDVDDIEYWMVVNEYEVMVVFLQNAGYKFIHFGKPSNPYTDRMNGIARMSVATSTTGTVIVSLDRDITANVQVGQKIWLLNLTEDGQVLSTDDTELVTVTAVTSNSITVSGVTHQPYAIGSFVGLDSIATHCYLSPTFGILDTVNNPDGNALGSGTNKSMATVVSYENEFDPGWDGMYLGFRVYPVMSSPNYDFRGYWDHVRVFSRASQMDEDIYRVDFNDSDRWKFFPSLGAITSYCVAIGPGAS